METVQHIDLSETILKEGEWYAFDIEGKDEFFAEVSLLSKPGWVLLKKIPDPYICKICGLSYQEGHHFTPGDDHEYEARGRV